MVFTTALEFIVSLNTKHCDSLHIYFPTGYIFFSLELIPPMGGVSYTDPTSSYFFRDLIRETFGGLNLGVSIDFERDLCIYRLLLKE